MNESVKWCGGEERQKVEWNEGGLDEGRRTLAGGGLAGGAKAKKDKLSLPRKGVVVDDAMY